MPNLMQKMQDEYVMPYLTMTHISFRYCILQRILWNDSNRNIYVFIWVSKLFLLLLNAFLTSVYPRMLDCGINANFFQIVHII